MNSVANQNYFGDRERPDDFDQWDYVGRGRADRGHVQQHAHPTCWLLMAAGGTATLTYSPVGYATGDATITLTLKETDGSTIVGTDTIGKLHGLTLCGRA